MNDVYLAKDRVQLLAVMSMVMNLSGFMKAK